MQGKMFSMMIIAMLCTTLWVFSNATDYRKDILKFERRGHILTRDLFADNHILAIREEIAKEFDEKLLEAYQHRCEVHLKQLDAKVELGSEIGRGVQSPEEGEQLLRSKGIDVPFLQLFNLWKSSESNENIKKLVLSPRLAQIAASLLGSKSVCIYQDSLFVKRPGDGDTQWHSDLNLAPLDTNKFVTVWIPLTEIKKNTTGLRFASGSHRNKMKKSSSLEIGQRGNQLNIRLYERSLNMTYVTYLRKFDFELLTDYICLKGFFTRPLDLSDRYVVEDYGAIPLGSASWHHGWVLHTASGVPLINKKIKRQNRAIPSTSSSKSWSLGRAAFAISYFSGDGDSCVLPRSQRKKRMDSEDSRSYSSWLKGIPDGMSIGIDNPHPELPCVFEIDGNCLHSSGVSEGGGQLLGPEEPSSFQKGARKSSQNQSNSRTGRTSSGWERGQLARPAGGNGTPVNSDQEVFVNSPSPRNPFTTAFSFLVEFAKQEHRAFNPQANNPMDHTFTVHLVGHTSFTPATTSPAFAETLPLLDGTNKLEEDTLILRGPRTWMHKLHAMCNHNIAGTCGDIARLPRPAGWHKVGGGHIHPDGIHPG
eukprot:jgi/Bigna1/89580/estExt_fgenesh1_pg.C_520017